MYLFCHSLSKDSKLMFKLFYASISACLAQYCDVDGDVCLIQTKVTRSSEHRRNYLEKPDKPDPNFSNGLKWVPPSRHDIAKESGYTRFVFIADIHSHTNDVYVPNGDVLIMAGDILNRFLRAGVGDISVFASWFGALPHNQKFVVGGNHDGILDLKYVQDHVNEDYDETYRTYTLAEHQQAISILRSATTFKYLENEMVIAANYKLYGTPYSVGVWKPYAAFNRTAMLADIPDDTEILVTHGPPFHELDESKSQPEGAGCPLLGQVVRRIKPMLHVFGHIHEANGVENRDGIAYVNCAVVSNRTKASEGYCLENPPQVVDFPVRP